MKILLVEDELLIAEDLRDYLVDLGYDVTGIAITLDECLSMITKNRPDLVLLDISLRGNGNGLDAAKQLEILNIPFAFLTASTDHKTVATAVTLNPFAFISKPFNKQDISVALQLAAKKIQAETKTDHNLLNDCLFVRENSSYKKIKLADIQYVEAMGSYSKIVTSEKTYLLSYNLNHFMQNVSSPLFKKIHRSYIVNLQRIDGFDTSSVRIEKNTLPVSAQYQKELMEKFKKI